MRKNMNTFNVTGYIHSFGDANGRNMLELKVTGENSKAPGTEYIAGTMNIVTDEAGLNVIPVNFTYLTETYSSGKPNANFGIVKKIIEDNKTWVAVGKDAATKVRVSGSIGLNEFYNQEDTLVSTKVNEASFVSIVSELPAESERTRFKCDMLITQVTHVEADEEKNIAEDYAVVRGAMFNFRNELLPLDLVIRHPQGMAYFESLEFGDGPTYTNVWGTISCMTIKREITEESAWGTPTVRTVERRVREWTIVGANKEPYEFGEEGVMTSAELKEAMANREIHLAEIKKRAEDNRANRNAPAAAPAKTPIVNKSGAFSF